MRTAVFTIISNNYSAQARVLCQSLRRHEPEWKRYVLVVDDPLPKPLIFEEEAQVVNVRDLPLPVPDWFFFQYSILEANTAVKPWMFARLFDEGYDAVVYLDPDIKLYSSLDELRERLQDQNILLTPHLTEPYGDNYYPDEASIRRSGIHNLGFVAMRQTPIARKALAWWQEKLTHDCRVAKDEGIFVDQSWMDFAPCLYGAYLLNDPGYNIAYWNLHERPLKAEGFPNSPPICKGKPVGFLHFSGFDYRNPLALSKHQNRFRADNLPPDLIPLLHDYAQSLRENGINDAEKIPYRLHALDGLRIPDFLRADLIKQASIKAMIRNNTSSKGMAQQLLDYLCSPDPQAPCLPIFLARLYACRPDLQEAFVGCDHRLSIPYFVRWFNDNGRNEANFDPAFPSSGWWDRETAWQRRTRLVAEKLTRWLLGSNWNLAEPFLLALSPLYKSLYTPRLSKFASVPHHQRDKLQINLYGYFLASSGMGEVARSMSRALTHLGLEHRIVNLDHGGRSAAFDLPFSLPNSKAHIDIVAVNVDSFAAFLRQFPEEPGQRKYRIGFWLWEMETPPPDFSRAERLVDEIWCASEQNASTFRKHTHRPVRVAGLNLSSDWQRPHPFPFPEIPLAGRCVFVTLCDCLSYPERKNPVMALQAYLEAFPQASQDTLMLVKLSNGHHRPDTIGQLKELAGHRQDVFIRNIDLSSNEVMGLLQHADVLVSLHAQEGFGLPIAEAISLGKEVVVTGYGGNMDFCNSTNAWLVPFELYRLEKDIGPYRKGNLWALPNMSAAARYLKEIHSHWKKGTITRPPSMEINEICYRKVAENIAAVDKALGGY